MTPMRVAALMVFCLFCLSQCYFKRAGIEDPLGALLETGRVPDVQSHIEHPSHRKPATDQPRPCHPRGQVNYKGDRMPRTKEKDPQSTALRCQHCNKKLAHGIPRDITIRCPRCKLDTRFKEKA